MKKLKLRLLDGAGYAGSQLTFIEAHFGTGARLVIVETVPANPIAVTGALRRATSVPAHAPALRTTAAYHLADPRGPAWRSRIRPLAGRADWRSQLTGEAVDQGAVWYDRVKRDLPKPNGLAARQCHDEVHCGLSMLATSHMAMSALFGADGIDTFLMKQRVPVPAVYTSNGSEAITAIVLPTQTTEVSPTVLLKEEIRVMEVEQIPLPLDYRPLEAKDFELRAGSRISCAADRLIRQIVLEIFEEADGWKPTLYPDINIGEEEFYGSL